MVVSFYQADSTELPTSLQNFIQNQAWNLNTEPASRGLELEWRRGCLSLCHREKNFKPLYIDFIQLWRDLRISKKDSIARAIGWKGSEIRILDATAGLLSDTLKLLKLGCKVVAIEKSPVLFALALDAQRRAEQDPRWNNGGGKRFELHFGDCQNWIKNNNGQTFDAIYLDPMFAEKNKKSLSKGSMQILQDLFENELRDEENYNLELVRMFEALSSSGSRRLVIKRPKNAEPIFKKADHVFDGEAVRYDAYFFL